MQRRYTAATLLILTGIVGCSSPPRSALELPNGALPSGTAQVTVNGNGASIIHDVDCQSLGNGLNEINIGTTGARITVLVGEDAWTPKGVAFNDVQGFTGSYWQDLQGTARSGWVDQTYTLTGTADGFNTEHPYTRTMNDFIVKVAC